MIGRRPETALAALAVLVAALGATAPARAEEPPGARPLTAILSGAAHGAAGDADGAGTATIAVDLEQRELCYELSVADIAKPTAAHIHQGAAGEIGPPVVTLGPPDADGTAKGCLHLSRQLLQKLLDDPARYYVNVHTTELPAGALRGQLGHGGDRLSEGA